MTPPPPPSRPFLGDGGVLSNIDPNIHDKNNLRNNNDTFTTPAKGIKNNHDDTVNTTTTTTPNNPCMMMTTTPRCHSKTPRTPRTTPRHGGGGVVRTPGRTPKGRLPSPLPIQQRKGTNTTITPRSLDHFHQHHQALSAAPTTTTTTTSSRIIDAATTKDDHHQQCRLKTFDRVCKERVGEDIDGTLCDLGIQEWAVDDFEYVRRLGKGGVADVFLAKEKQSGFEVALKVQVADDNAICEMDLHRSLTTMTTMKQQHKQQQQYHHPNIVTMIGYFYSFERFGPCDDEYEQQEESHHHHHLYDPADGANNNHHHHHLSESSRQQKTLQLYMILEVCEGGSLHNVIDLAPDCALPESQAAKLLMGAICAIEYLHSQDVIHCDCKPANFLLGQQQGDTVVKLADFGMSVRANDRQVVGGSPVYMAPEHLMAWRHKTDRFDHRTDIYSLGVVLYELLVGYLPYEVKGAPKATMGDLMAEDEEDMELQGGTLNYSTMEDMNGVSIDEYEDEDFDDDDEDMWPILDLRKLHDHASDEPFYIPPPIFVEEISAEAQDLVNRLMEPSLSKRITLAEAKEHPWFQLHLGSE